MLVLIFQGLYLIIFLSMILMCAFIIFHIVFYAYKATSKIVTLLIFVPVAAILLFTNAVLFFNIPLQDILEGFI